MARGEPREISGGGEGADEAELLEEPRSRAVIHAELREICARHMKPETLEWFRVNFPLHGDQLELFR
jgi:hypothetical protein